MTEILLVWVALPCLIGFVYCINSYSRAGMKRAPWNEILVSIATVGYPVTAAAYIWVNFI